MAKKQKWSIDTDGDIYNVEFSCKGIAKKISIRINDDVFELPKSFFESPARKEILKLGDTQAVLDINKKGKATIYIGSKQVEEDKC